MFDNQNNAQNVLLSSGIQFFTGAVSNYDGVDYYKIQVNNRSDFNLSLSELKGDANVYLLDSTGQSLGSSNLTGSSSEAINATLEAGTYFVKVNFAQDTAVKANLPYQLAIANNPIFSNIDDKNPNGQKFYTGDFNGDGLQDVFRQERGDLVDGSKDAEVFIGNAQGRYDTIQITNAELFQGNRNRLVLGDFNGDGKTDIIRQEYDRLDSAVSYTQFTSFKDGKFQVVGDLQEMSAMRGTLTNLIAGDFNGDGRDDIIRQEKGYWVNGVRDVELYISDGKFKWSDRKVLSNASALTGNDTLLVAGDFIAGGGKDLIKIKTNNQAIDGVNDIQYLSYQKGNMALAGNSPTNIISKAPQINGLNSSYDANSTLTLSNSYVFDSNGWKDVSKVDFWLTNAQGQRLELNDVDRFTAKDANNAQFKYSTTLSGVEVGDYKLNAVAYDKSGTGSSQFTKAFKIINNAPDPLIQDWFGLNLKDVGTIDLVRTAANDGQLDRKDMLKILQGMEDGGVVDNSELADLKKLLQANEEKLFSISESVRYLSNKIAIESAPNSNTEQFEYEIGKWLKGQVAPTAVFHRNGGTTFNLQYKEFTGSLFGANKEARIGGIDQLQFGDCVLFSSLGATFAPQSSDAGNSSSKTINEMLIDNGDNTYAVRFYNTDQKAEWVTVDNRLATYNGAIFGANTKDGLWAPIIEKAYAQWFELKEGSSTKTGWDIIGNGDYYNVGLQRITGRTNTSYYKNEAAYDYSFTLIKDALVKGQAIIAGATNNPNLIDDHAYSVTNAYIDSKGQERVVVRNPWGIDKDRSTAVTGENDGFIDLSYSDFRSFKEINIA
jgi:Calpain family cysteine protease/Bacterial pre-peptidase C-terminal domain/FG-GAP-like repeat